MRAVELAAVVGILVAPSAAFAQGQSSAAMTVSVRVVRSCNVAEPGGSGATRITAQCGSAAQPQTQLSDVTRKPVALNDATTPPMNAAPQTRDVRVLTVNF